MNLPRNQYQRNSSWNAPYTFSGKEKDAETGYGYFGARYYDSGLSIWLSVDPMSDKYPSMSPYNYCANNPVILVDPDGRDIFLIFFKGINGEDTREIFNELIKKGTNGQFECNYIYDEKTKLTKLELKATANGGDIKKMGILQQAFHKRLNNMINNHSKSVTINLKYGNQNTEIGNQATKTIDLGDINQYDEIGIGFASKQGKLIHEITEMLYNSHESGKTAENEVNGTTRAYEISNPRAHTYDTYYTKGDKTMLYSYDTYPKSPILNLRKSWSSIPNK